MNIQNVPSTAKPSVIAIFLETSAIIAHVGTTTTIENDKIEQSIPTVFSENPTD